MKPKELICKRCGRVLAQIDGKAAIIKYRPRDASEKHTAEIFGYVRIRCMCGAQAHHRSRVKLSLSNDRQARPRATAVAAGVERGEA